MTPAAKKDLTREEWLALPPGTVLARDVGGPNFIEPRILTIERIERGGFAYREDGSSRDPSTEERWCRGGLGRDLCFDIPAAKADRVLYQRLDDALTILKTETQRIRGAQRRSPEHEIRDVEAASRAIRGIKTPNLSQDLWKRAQQVQQAMPAESPALALLNATRAVMDYSGDSDHRWLSSMEAELSAWADGQDDVVMKRRTAYLLGVSRALRECAAAIRRADLLEHQIAYPPEEESDQLSAISDQDRALPGASS